MATTGKKSLLAFLTTWPDLPVFVAAKPGIARGSCTVKAAKSAKIGYLRQGAKAQRGKDVGLAAALRLRVIYPEPIR